MYGTVIWATDGSDGADLALAEARRLVDPDGGRIIVAHCNQRLTGRAMAYPALPDEDERLAKIRGQVDQLNSERIDVELVVRQSHSEPADVVAAIADEIGADVIVCGTRGHGALSGALFGSFAQRLLHVAASCPVMIVPEAVALVPQAERATEVRA